MFLPNPIVLIILDITHSQSTTKWLTSKQYYRSVRFDYSFEFIPHRFKRNYCVPLTCSCSVRWVGNYTINTSIWNLLHLFEAVPEYSFSVFDFHSYFFKQIPGIFSMQSYFSYFPVDSLSWNISQSMHLNLRIVLFSGTYVLPEYVLIPLFALISSALRNTFCLLFILCKF